MVPERSIGGSFADEPLSQYGFYWDWQVAPQWNLCNAPGVDEPRVAKSKVKAVREFLASDRQGAGLHPRHLPLCGGRAGHRGVRRSPDRHRRVPPRLQQPGQRAGQPAGRVHRPRQGASGGHDRLVLPWRQRGGAWRRRTKPGSRRSPTPTTSSSTATSGSSRWTSATSSTPAVMSMRSPRCWTRH